MKQQSVWMTDMTFPELGEYLKHNRTVILPYALSEQHGAHLPLDTDIRNAKYASELLAKKLGCVVAPVLNYCFSGGMFPGTINVKPTTFSTLVGEIIESLTVQGFRNFIIIPGHGGSENIIVLKEALRILKWVNPSLRDDLILLTQIWDFCPTWIKLFKEQDYHAAWAETSLMMHWCPEVVRNIKQKLDVPKVAARLREDPDSYQLRESFTNMSQEIVQTSQRPDVKIGCMGWPEKASAEFGAKLEAEFVKNAPKAILKAIADADRARKSGKRIVHADNVKLKILSL